MESAGVAELPVDSQKYHVYIEAPLEHTCRHNINRVPILVLSFGMSVSYWHSFRPYVSSRHITWFPDFSLEATNFAGALPSLWGQKGVRGGAGGGLRPCVGSTFLERFD